MEHVCFDSISARTAQQIQAVKMVRVRLSFLP